MNSQVDVRDTLVAVQAPTLVLHRRDDVDSDVAPSPEQHLPAMECNTPPMPEPHLQQHGEYCAAGVPLPRPNDVIPFSVGFLIL